MSDKFVLNASVTYADVDRAEVMALSRIFKLLQEAAIIHAAQFGAGRVATAERVETWVLNRIAVAIARYPQHGETLRVETWSNGVKGCKGRRDFRLYDAAQQPILRASSLWLYLNLRSQSLTRVPREVAAGFPMGREPAAYSDLEETSWERPNAAACAVPVTLRYADVDVNGHVNNAAYLDLVQTALVAAGRRAHPHGVRLKYAKAIPAELTTVQVRVESAGEITRFSIEDGDSLFAVGEANDQANSVS